jgi:carboxypeptidase Q
LHFAIRLPPSACNISARLALLERFMNPQIPQIAQVRRVRRRGAPLAAVLVAVIGITLAGSQDSPYRADLDMVAKIREEGFQRSRVMDLAAYMSDVLGARLTLSEHMKRAQAWAKAEMERIGLVNTVIEPFMDYGVAWDNEYCSLHMLEPDYQMLVGFPLANTPGTDGNVTARAVIVDIQVKQDLEKYRGRLKGAAILVTPPAAIDAAALSRGVARRTDEELAKMEQAAIPTAPRVAPRPPPNPDVLRPEEKMAFYKAEGVAVVFQCEGGFPGAVRGFARPGTRQDGWSREGDLAVPPIVAVTPEHYNRMYRILKREIPVNVEVEIRNRIGQRVEQASNVLGEIPGTDLKDEIVMIGAHLDTWHASPNSSDDTAGCAVALEAARILRAVGAKPRRTIRVALWGGEEQGLHGSREYVLKHFGDPKKTVTPEYERFSVYFNQDYGAGQYRGIYLQGNEHVRQMFAAWMKPFRDLGMTAISIQSVGSTDHVSFDNAGLPAFQFLQDRVGGTAGHTNLDFYDTLQADDLMKNAVIMASFAWHAATADARVPRKTVRPTT